MIKRMWINQPSTRQPFHNRHGQNVLAVKESETVHRVYFLAGAIVSQQMPTLCLSAGWPSEKEN